MAEPPYRRVIIKVSGEALVGPGGFGIRLVQQLADELLYNEKQNEVILIKYLDQ